MTFVYSFDELSDKAKEKARDWYREGSLDDFWWESIYGDAADIGLKITSFNLDRNRHANGYFTETHQEVAELIIGKHGENCETYKTAKAYLSDIGKDNDERESFAAEFEKSLIEDYSMLLQEGYQYLMSDEQVDESIIANKYSFTESGKRFG